MKYNGHWSTDAIDTWHRITYNDRYESLRDYPFDGYLDNQNDDPIFIQGMGRTEGIQLVSQHGSIMRRNY